MKFKSEIVTQASGSIGGVTYAHNRGGLYRRARSIPTNPSSAAQQTVRNIMSQLMVAWRATLTDAQRDGWKVYADNTPVTDALGDELILTGPQMYVRGNVPRIQAGLARVDAAPTTFGLPDLGTIGLTGVTASTDTIVATYDNTAPWANQDDGALLVYASSPRSPTINFFKGPYQFAGKVDGDAVTPPTSPTAIVSPFDYAVGQKVFVKIQAVDEEGRLSPVFRGGVVAS